MAVVMTEGQRQTLLFGNVDERADCLARLGETQMGASLRDSDAEHSRLMEKYEALPRRPLTAEELATDRLFRHPSGRIQKTKMYWPKEWGDHRTAAASA